MKIREIITEAPLPDDWDHNEFRANANFESRLRYALARSEKLGTGSSRVATVIEFQGRETVLKIAKNQKGLAQNEAEANVLSDPSVSNIVIPIIDYDEKNSMPVWIHTELAQPAGEATLCRAIHCDDLMTLVFAIKYIIAPTNPYRLTGYSPEAVSERMLESGQTESEIKIFFSYVYALAELYNHYSVNPGDFANYENWGFYKGKPVVIDVGYTDSVMKKYYTQY